VDDQIIKDYIEKQESNGEKFDNFQV